MEDTVKIGIILAIIALLMFALGFFFAMVK
jgi:uncharacterized membrane protein